MMLARTQTNSDQIDGSALLRTVLSKLPRIILWSLAAGAAAYGISALKAPVYESEAQISIVARGGGNPLDPKTGGMSPDSTSVRMDKEAVNTHMKALQSPDLVVGLAKSLGLEKKVEFNNELGSVDQLSALLRMVGIGAPRSGETEQDRVVSEFFKRLEVYSPKESRLIGVRFESVDPELAATIANKLTETYRANLASQNLAETDEVQKVLAPKIAQLKTEVLAADQEVEKFKAEANIFKGGQQATGLNEQQLGELSAELVKAKAARSEAEARLKSSREMVKAGSAEALPDVQKSPLITNLIQSRVQLERQISENAVANLPGHPVSRKLEADLAGLRRQISTEIAKIADGLEKEAKIAGLREESVAKSLNEVKARVVTTSPDEVKLRSLEATSKSKRAELDRLEAQFEANRVKVGNPAVGVEAQIVSQARPQSVPISPKKLANALLVSTATLLLALALVVTKGLLTGAGRNAAPVSSIEGGDRRYAGGDRRAADPRLEPQMAEKVYEKPSLKLADAAGVAAKPQLSPADAAAKVSAAFAAQPSVSPAGVAGAQTTDSIEAICDTLTALAKGPNGYRTLLAAESEALGAGTEAFDLAHCLSERGKAVLLIDWALAGNSVVSSLGLSADPGLAGLLGGSVTFEDTIRAIPGSDIHVITAGSRSTDMIDTRDPQKLNMLLDALDEAYEHIIVACPFEDGRSLFEAIEGRFDAGLTVSEHKKLVVAGEGAANTFLGFDVADIKLINFERSAPSSASSGIARLNRTKKSSSLV